MSKTPLVLALLLTSTAAFSMFIGKLDITEPALAEPSSSENIVVGRDEALMIWGSEYGSEFGASISAGDIDGDGRDDMAIGMPGSDMGRASGAVLIFFSRDIDELYPLYGHYDADLVIYGEDTDDRFGSSTLLYDLDGDGRSEILIGAPYADGPGEARRDSGEVYVIQGRSRSAFKTTFDLREDQLFGRVYGRDIGDHLGMLIRCADLDADGFPDLVVRSEGRGGKIELTSVNENEAVGSWEVEVFNGSFSSGSSLDLSSTLPTVTYYGSAIVTDGHYAQHIGMGLDTGDLDGDGIDDLAFTYRWDGEGRLCLFKGGPSYPYTTPGNKMVVEQGVDFDPQLTVDLSEDGFEDATVSFGDLDGDTAKEDLLVGLPQAPAYEAHRRKAGQFDGYIGRALSSDLDLSRWDAAFTVFGEDASDLLGTGALTLDFDLDGMDELLISMPGGDGTDNTLPNCGEALLFDLGPPGKRWLNVTDAADRFMGIGQGASSFSSLAVLDINGDLTDEFLVSSPGAEPLSGEPGYGLVSMFMQQSTFEARFVGEYPASNFGESTLFGDFNGDSYTDLVVGDPHGGEGQQGYAYMFLGGPYGWAGRYFASTNADIAYDDVAAMSKFARELDVGDLNDDGYDDLVIGVPEDYLDSFWPDCGSVRIFWGGPGSSLYSKQNKMIRGYDVERAGSAIAVGDYNGDSIDDLAISTPYELGTRSNGRFHAGVVYIFLGPLSNTQERTDAGDVRIIGSMDNELLGESLASGDIDDDGFDDLVIGAPNSQAGSITRQGAVYILKGRSAWTSPIDLRTDQELRLLGAWPFDRAGSSLKCGDMDGDGMADLVVGADNADGYERSTLEAGAVYLMTGEHLSTKLGKNDISLKDGANVTIYGDQMYQGLGGGLELGDVDGDGSEDLVIGSPGWTDPLIGVPTGCVHIFPGSILSDDLRINSSSLPYIKGFMEGDKAGTSISAMDIDSDGRDDLFIGAPDSDPLGDGTSPGGVYLWMSKDLYLRDYKVSTVRVLDAVKGNRADGRTVDLVAPREGPYSFFVSGRSVHGSSDITEIGFSLSSDDVAGTAEFRYSTVTQTFSYDTSGGFNGGLSFDEAGSRAWSDGFQSWYAEFSVHIDWALPDPHTVTTYITGSTGGHINYLSESFVIDRGLTLGDDEMRVLLDNGQEVVGWINATTGITISNVTLLHTLSQTPFSENAFKTVEIGLFRPDGIRIGTAELNGTTLKVNRTVPGDGISSERAAFYLGRVDLPYGSSWAGNLTIPLDIDTVAPPAVSSFILFPDGKESGTRDRDDDQIVELYWENVIDMGGSGMAGMTLEVRDGTGGLLSSADQYSSSDLMMLPMGDLTVSIAARDLAGNVGPWTERGIIVDLLSPYFSSHVPSGGSWVNPEGSTFSVIVNDSLSGIDAKSGFYRLYRSDARMLSDWTPVQAVETVDNGLRLIAVVPLNEGFGHYIQWSVSDQCGVQERSQIYQYNMDGTPPEIEFDDGPLDIGPGPVVLECYMEDTLSGLDLSSISYRIASKAEIGDADWIELGSSGSGASASPRIEVLPDFEGAGFVQWRVEDQAGNLMESEMVQIFVDRTMPAFTGFEPGTGSVQNELVVPVAAYIEESGSGLTIYDVEVSVSTIAGWVLYGVGGYSPWKTVDGLEYLGLGSYMATTTVSLDKGPFNLVRFRAMDTSGNGWVVSIPMSIEVELPETDLPPIARFTMFPMGDFIYQGENFVLDGSASYDPEKQNLTYMWYSDIEGYPSVKRIGSGAVVNVTLSTLGVHTLWLVVSDGKYDVESEELHIQVLAREAEDTGESEESMADTLYKALPYLILLFIIGLLIGGLAVFLFMRRRREMEGQYQHAPVMVDARIETEEVRPNCPYCGRDVRSTDEYCMSCGTVFSAKDKEAIAKGKRKKKRKSLGPGEPPLPPTEEGSDEKGEKGDELAGVFQAEEPSMENGPGSDAPDEDEVEEMEEIEELEEEEGAGEDESEDWGVGN